MFHTYHCQYKTFFLLLRGKQLGGTGYTMVSIGIPSTIRCLDGGLENCIA